MHTLIALLVGILLGAVTVWLLLHKAYLNATESKANEVISAIRAEFEKLLHRAPIPIPPQGLSPEVLAKAQANANQNKGFPPQ